MTTSPRLGAAAMAVIPARPPSPHRSSVERSARGGGSATRMASAADAAIRIARLAGDSDSVMPSWFDVRSALLRTTATRPATPSAAPEANASLGIGLSAVAQAAPAAGRATASSGSTRMRWGRGRHRRNAGRDERGEAVRRDPVAGDESQNERDARDRGQHHGGFGGLQQTAAEQHKNRQRPEPDPGAGP